jgi:hypothetical protein
VRQDLEWGSEVEVSTSRNSTPLYEAIRSLVWSARQSAARGVNLLQVYTDYKFGRRIFEQEQQGTDRAQYGMEVVRELATRLTGEFGSGFSKSNLEYMRRSWQDRVCQRRQLSLNAELTVVCRLALQ